MSTPEPVGAPRWEIAPPDVDFSKYFTPGEWTQPTTTGYSGTLNMESLGLGISPSLTLDSMSLGSSPQAKDWSTAYQPAPEYKGGRFDEQGLKQAMSIPRSGGFGLSAYGFSGTTGQTWQKGRAPYGFQTVLWNQLQKINQAMQAAGLGRLRITDGFRSYAKQVATKKKKGDLAATPGRSLHGLGLAADLALTPKQQKWLEKNAASFGVQRLPSESWHWQLLPSLWTGKFDRRA